MNNQHQEAQRFEKWASEEGYDTAHTYDTERNRWVFLNPMTADLWKAWQAASSPPAPTGWQPLETAPMNESVLLAIDGKLITMGARSPGIGWYWEPVDDEEDDSEATHWQPLPPPPAEVSNG